MMSRFLNNPEILSGSTFFGLAVITASKSVLILAILSNLSYWWFLKHVEKYVSSILINGRHSDNHIVLICASVMAMHCAKMRV